LDSPAAHTRVLPPPSHATFAAACCDRWSRVAAEPPLQKAPPALGAERARVKEFGREFLIRYKTFIPPGADASVSIPPRAISRPLPQPRVPESRSGNNASPFPLSPPSTVDLDAPTMLSPIFPAFASRVDWSPASFCSE